ncbi:putative sugar kinase [Halobacteroides halobius DSM 5150]|uniref:NAD kinase n=1 Tax=Halobacteroides halobius (strain ATCC 35273 / DSM 5150 / MD-1) TaxID=748449 RepID=L0K8U2_HALHC|nr:NAD(+)/NADH kinase [Halobacteroides halobius]AGB40538.1 putative sugar kinase [Halobacteroides halobius DSM 5150]
MDKIAIIANNKKEEISQVLLRVCNLLDEHKQDYILEKASAKLIDKQVENVNYKQIINYATKIIVLGGDGTFLNVARTFANSDVSILGINLGRLGFLTDIEVNKLETGLEKLLAKDYNIEERMMLKGEVIRDGEVIHKTVAANDIVVTKGPFARIINLKTMIGDQYLATYPADGLIVACPTGSTAYSLSAGGPIVNPRLESLIITPICPHTLHSRSIVIGKDEKVKIEIEADHKDIMLTVDGQNTFELAPQDTVRVSKSELITKLIKLKGYSFYQVLRNRMNENKF